MNGGVFCSLLVLRTFAGLPENVCIEPLADKESSSSYMIEQRLDPRNESASFSLQQQTE